MKETKHQSYHYLIVPNEMVKYNREIEHPTLIEYYLDNEIVAVIYKKLKQDE